MYCHKTGGTGGDRTYQAQLQGRKVHCSVDVGGGGRRRTLGRGVGTAFGGGEVC